MAAGASPDDNEIRQQVIRMLTRLRCVDCGRLYDPEDFRLVHRWTDVWILSTRCRHCQQPVHVVVYLQMDAEPGPMLDLTPEEVDTIGEFPAITLDDVLDVHQLLETFEGGFEELFTT